MMGVGQKKHKYEKHKSKHEDNAIQAPRINGKSAILKLG